MEQEAPQGQGLRIEVPLMLKLSLSLIFDRRRHYLARAAVVPGLKRLNTKGLRAWGWAKKSHSESSGIWP